MDLKPQKKKIYLGKAKKYFTKIQVAEFDLEAQELQKGDSILITGRTTGVIEAVADEIRINDSQVKEVKKGDNFSMKINCKVQPNDKLYKVLNS